MYWFYFGAIICFIGQFGACTYVLEIRLRLLSCIVLYLFLCLYSISLFYYSLGYDSNGNFCWTSFIVVSYLGAGLDFFSSRYIWFLLLTRIMGSLSIIWIFNFKCVEQGG